MTTSANQTHPGYLDDPATYDGVLGKRVIAFIVDYLIVLVLCGIAAIAVTFIGILTLGLGFMLYPLIFFVVAIPYIGLTLGGSEQATPGMRMTGLRMVRIEGGPVDFWLAVIHAVLFWAFNAVLSPLILLLALFLDRRQTLHDRLLGVAMVRG